MKKTAEQMINQAQDLLEQAKSLLEKKEEIVMVPDFIRMSWAFWDSWIVFCKWEQQLFYNLKLKSYWVVLWCDTGMVKCKLVKTSKSEIEAGDWYVDHEALCVSLEHAIKNTYWYRMYLWGICSIYWDCNHGIFYPRVTCGISDEVYKVVEIK